MKPEISAELRPGHNSCPPLNWPEITTVLLDMDGTLLDKHYDDYFWEQYLPQVYGEQKGLALDRAKQDLYSRYRSVEKTLMWTDLNYWSRQLELDIISLKNKLRHLIGVHPHVIRFLDYLKGHGKSIYLITAANRESLSMKMDTVDLRPYFRQLICAEDIGHAKEHGSFWRELEKQLGFDRERTFFADDTVPVLRAAREYGIRHLLHIARPSSRREPSYCKEFRSVDGFHELLPASTDAYR
jgi:putative hydrolase of the HAD superfamily